MITFLKPLPVGNAVRALLAPPEGAEVCRVLRRLDPDFTGEDDAGAVVAYEGRDSYFVDDHKLKNDTVYFYCPFYRIGSDWEPGDVESVVPVAGLRAIWPDPLEKVRERLEAGLRVEVVEGHLKATAGLVPCFTAPPAYDGTNFPIMTVHMDNDAPSQRGIGEIVMVDVQDDDGMWREAEGWLSTVRLKIVGWMPQNADVRNKLRLATKMVLVGNLPVFAAAGMDQVEFSQADVEDMESYAVPMYQTITTLTCNAVYLVESRESAIADVTVTATAA